MSWKETVVRWTGWHGCSATIWTVICRRMGLKSLLLIYPWNSLERSAALMVMMVGAVHVNHVASSDPRISTQDPDEPFHRTLIHIKETWQ